MKTIPYEVKTGADNMQTDNDLLEYAIENHLKTLFSDFTAGRLPAFLSGGTKKRIF